MLKRGVDIVFATVLLSVFLPLLLVLAAIVKLDSEGPAIFCQVRMGRKFRRFQLYKLRTMGLGGSGSAYTLGADPRITRAGRWMRRFKLDELPQLWNVLRGDMSIVGPRPVIPELAVEFRWAYAGLLEVRPGLTDPASLEYCNETEILDAVEDPLIYFKTIVTPDKIRISQNYLQRADSWTDLGVVVMTAFVLVSPHYRRQFSRQPSMRPVKVLRPGLAPRVARAASIQANFQNASRHDTLDLSPSTLENSSHQQPQRSTEPVSI